MDPVWGPGPGVPVVPCAVRRGKASERGRRQSTALGHRRESEAGDDSVSGVDGEGRFGDALRGTPPEHK
jgi:hypothetical protein